MMRTFTSISLFFLLMLAFNSCRKDKNPLSDGVNCTGKCYILTGKLIDSAANNGIANGELKFYFRSGNYLSFNPTTYIGKCATDANGIYSFQFDGSSFNNRNGYFYAEAFKGNMFANLHYYPNRVGTLYLDSTWYNIPFVQNFLLFKPATLKVRIIASTVTNFQYLNVNATYGAGGNGISFNGSRTIDTTVIWKTAGDLKTKINSYAVGNGVNIVLQDSIVEPTNGTRQIEIRL